jgi:S-formylglutathione hydrolase
MKFMIYLPDETIKAQRGKPYPALYFLSGITSTHENAAIKSHFGPHAAKHRIALVFPDTSPRGADVGSSENWELG